MSDIPVGSPPAPPGRHAAPSGWYVDPVNSAQERYWDGWQWSRNTRPFEQTAPGAGYGQAPYSPYPAANGGGPNVRPPLGRPGARPMSMQATTTADGVPLASWWWRALAVVIDNVILSAIVTIVTFPVWQSLYAAWTSYFDAVLEAQRLGVAPPTMSVTELISGRNQLILTVATIGIGMLYHVGFHAGNRQHLGSCFVGCASYPLITATPPVRCRGARFSSGRLFGCCPVSTPSSP